jgi:hypothetical protein
MQGGLIQLGPFVGCFEIVWSQCLNIHNNLTNRGFVLEMQGGLIQLGPLVGCVKNCIS